MSIFLAKFFQTIISKPIYFILKLLVDYKVEGQENLKGLEKKAVIFSSNHASYIDGPICGAAMPNHHFFPVRFLILDQFFKLRYILIPVFLKLNAGIKLKKIHGSLGLSLMETILALIFGGKVWIYPEGKLTLNGEIHSGKRGIGFLHKMTSAPIVPVGIAGNFNIISRKYIWKRTKVRVKIGKPLYDLVDLTSEEIVSRLMSEIIKLEKEAEEVQ
ncbi:MAG: lysophospholipid acyltransferase family protein [Patescibacteria group bacterium]